MSRFDDRVAIATGAGSGAGAAIATRLAEEGASVVCTDLDGAHQTAALLGKRGRAVRLDVADAGSVARLARERGKGAKHAPWGQGRVASGA